MAKPTFLTPSETNFLVKHALEDNPIFNDLWITGEISNMKFYPKNNTTYFSLTDEQSQLNCVLYGNFLQNISFKLENGKHVLCRGKLSVFHKRGSYSYQVAFMSDAGEGQKNKKLQALKAALEKEGLFDAERKKAIPKYVQHVACLTSYPSAAASDVIKQFKHLAPHIRLSFIPVTVQGQTAVASITNGLTRINELSDPDCICLFRGGGSQEDLDIFNNETLVRTLSTLHLPLISAIGHEQDVTLTDYVADQRCSTPTEAAIMLSSPYVFIEEDIPKRLHYSLETIVDKLDHQKESTRGLLESASFAMSHQLSSLKKQTKSLLRSINLASPLKKFEQGFSICSTENGDSITSVSMVSETDVISTRCIDGEFTSKVIHVKKNTNTN